MTQHSPRIGVDIGGTFTDVALSHAGGISTAKTLTNHSQPERAILDGITIVTERAGVAPVDITQVIHGTTLVANALIERRGAKTAFITTAGFRDVIEMRSESRFEQYDLNLQLPAPLIERRHRFTAEERMSSDGQVLLPLQSSEINRLIQAVTEGGYAAVAIGFMHAYANDVHERKMAEALRTALPELSISLSSVVSPQMRELHRFNTVVANAYVQPRVSDYLRRLVDCLREAEIIGRVFMLHSGGGLISVETAIEQPVRLLESGPAGGAVFAAEYARAYRLKQALSFDMGGTTAKICLIENGTPKTASASEVARSYRFKKGSGMAVSTPVTEMVEIGAGGGSIASIDLMGRIQVGPRSADSEPGPACYQRGGTEPTVTDANLLLGRLDPENFAAGAIPLSREKSAKAVAGQLSVFSVEDAAFGITEMVDENMANAARVHAVENGRDIEQFTMIAFGGGAPLHACRLCEKMGIRTLLVPPGAGVGSAIGFLMAPVSYEATRGLFQQLAAFNPSAVNAAIRELEAEARTFVEKGAANARTHTELACAMRYSGQGSEIAVSLPLRDYTKDDATMIHAAFENAYRMLFGRVIEGLEVEITNWSLKVATRVPDTRPVERVQGETEPPVMRNREFFDAALRQRVVAREVTREEMKKGAVVAGPAVIVERETSTIVTSAYQAVGQADGSLLLVRKETANERFNH